MAQTVPFMQPFENRRGSLDQTQAAGVQIQRVSGTILVEGTGQVSADVRFPVHFIEKPAVSFGADIKEAGGDYTDYPTISVVVLSWTMEGETERINSGNWVGATLAIVVAGLSTQQMWVHWHVEGHAYRNPLT